MLVVTLVLLLNALVICSSEENASDVDHYVISCRSTDFTCFQRQYQSLRDLVMAGSQELAVPEYRPYRFQYADTNTCVQMTGLEQSQLIAISFDGFNKELSLTVSMPVLIQQVAGTWKEPCELPETEFSPRGLKTGPYKKFTCNATMIIQFPVRLYKEARQVYASIEDEELEVVLDVPDLRSYDRESRVETNIYRNSEWAYEMVRHVNVPDHVMVPFMQRLKTIYNRVPLHRFIQLYPTEHYNELLFKFHEDKTISYKKAIS